MPAGVYKHHSQQGFQKGHPCLWNEGSRVKKRATLSKRKEKLGYINSPATRKKVSKALKGRTSPNKGKKMSPGQKGKIRQSHLKRWDKIGRKPKRPYHGRWEYTHWKLKVFQRDSFTCQGCNRVGGNLEAHHIKSFVEFPNLRYELDNGVTLCKECHKLTDGYGKNVQTLQKTS